MTNDDPDLAALAKLKHAHQNLREQIARVVVGQDEVIEQLMICIFARGHCMLEGVPGLAKTLAVKSLANCLHVKFSRLQFTPDMLPADVVGTQIYNPQSGGFSTRKGPVFANLVLADEINRAPVERSSCKTSVPVMSLGIRSGVN